MHTHTRDWSSKAEALTDGAVTQSAELLLEVDFKWLMAGQGCWVDPMRLRVDPLYASNCLLAAINSPCEALSWCARVLQKTLKPSAASLQGNTAPA